MNLRLKLAGVLSAALLALPIVSCSDRSVLSPNGLRNGPGAASYTEIPRGTFTWLAPLGTGTANPSTFDAAVVTSVEVCLWVNSACSGAPIITFTNGGASALVANTTVGQYEANWSLLSTSLLLRHTYRIRALSGATELGGILVDVVRGRWGLTRTDGQLAVLLAANELPIRFHVAVVPLAPVKINEIESNGGVPDDWVELYNPSAQTVDLSGFEFRDNDDTHHFFFAQGTTIAPGAFLVIDGNTADPKGFSFGLGSADAARLFDQFGRLVDSYTWTQHAATTYGRCPNGTGAFVETASSTKGTANDCSNPVKVNEVESSDPTGGPDWIELYNPGAITVDLSGYKLHDNDGNSFTIPAGVTIASHQFLAFTQNAANSFTFGLGSADGATLADPQGNTIDTFSWTAHAAVTYGRCPDGTGAFVNTNSATKGLANDCATAAVANVKINEVTSNDPDFIELINLGTTAADLSGYVLKDNDNTHAFTIPNGTTIAPGALLAFDALGFGLGSSDQARLFSPSGTLIDSFTWTMHPPTSYGRCVDPIAGLTMSMIANVRATKGAANACPTPWPGAANDITTVDVANTFSSNLSGLMYEVGLEGAPDVLWGARNGPGSLYRMILSGGNWIPDPSNGWGNGKLLHYTDGTGDTDSEDLTFTTGSSAGMYVATERNNSNNTVSRPAILRFDVSGTATELTATHEWNLTADLPVVGPNLGLEAIQWIPDSYLVAKGFFDEAAGHIYNPADYPDHAGGLFFVGLEGNGFVYAYALNHTNSTFTRITSFFTGFPAGVMALHFDRELGYLWANCDDTCGGLADIWEIDTTPGSPTLGHMRLTHIFNRPSGMPNFNNEGFAFTPLSLCSGGLRPAFWSDDTNDAGHSIRRGSIPCVPFP